MKVKERLCRIVRDPRGDGLIASDSVGRIHRLDSDLRLLDSSPVTMARLPFYSLLVTGDWIVGRDKLGNFARWDLRNLRLVNWIATEAASDAQTLWDDEDPSLTISRGIAELEGKVYANNGFMQMVVLDLETFAVEQVRPSPAGDTPIEWICVDLPGAHAVTDKHGNLRIGDLATGEFPISISLDEDANLHRVRYDHRHDRFWVIQDEGAGETALISNGVVTVTPDGRVDQELRFALDDIECLEMSSDARLVYAAGFDGVVEEFDNTDRTLKRARTIGPFSHQVSDMAIADDGSLYVLCQDGALTRVAADGRTLAALDFHRQCLWDVATVASDDHGSVLQFAADDGVVTVQVESQPDSGRSAAGAPLALTMTTHLDPQLGFCRRISVLEDGGGVVIGRSGRVARYDAEGVVWTVGFDTIVHDLAVTRGGDRLMVATNAGAVELATEDGREVARHTIAESPIWACAYLADGRRLISSRSGVTVVLSSEGAEVSRFEIGDFPKRMWEDDAGHLVVTGGGGIRTFDIPSGRSLRHYHEAMSNTAENAAFFGGFVYVVTYDSQLGVFAEDGEFLGVIEGVLPDFPKALAVVSQEGRSCLLVGGRGGYIQTFELGKDGTAVPASTTWISGAPPPVPRHYSIVDHDG